MGEPDENGVPNLIFRTPSFYFPLPLLITAIEDHFWRVVKDNPLSSDDLTLTFCTLFPPCKKFKNKIKLTR